MILTMLFNKTICRAVSIFFPAPSPFLSLKGEVGDEGREGLRGVYGDRGEKGEAYKITRLRALRYYRTGIESPILLEKSIVSVLYQYQHSTTRKYQ